MSLYPFMDFYEEMEEGKKGLRNANYLKTDGGLWIPQSGTSDGATKTQLTGSNVDNIESGINSLSPGNKELFSFSNLENNQMLFDSGPGESLVVDNLEIVSDTINRPEITIEFYDKENNLKTIDIAVMTGTFATLINNRIRFDYLSTQMIGNGLFQVYRNESGKYHFGNRVPLVFPNGVRIRTNNVSENNIILFSVLN